MKKIFAIAVIALLALSASSSFASIGWAGNIYPCHMDSYASNQDISVYFQVWKDGCTQGAGACPGIAAWLYYKKATDALYDSIPMPYLGEVGNNDEYRGIILSAWTEGGINEDFYCRAYDSTDGTWYDGAQTQYSCENYPGHNPPHALVITPATSQDVTVTFRVDMNCVNPAWFAGGVFFTGDFLGWNSCVTGGAMADPDMDGIWEGTYLFLEGSNPSVQYKFQRHDGGGCNWEPGGNKSFVIDDSQPTQILDIYAFNCDTWGPWEITGPGSFCVGLCCCPNERWIMLNTMYDSPILNGVTIVPGCVDCGNPDCGAGFGDVAWRLELGGDNNWYMVLCLEDPVGAHAYAGCFCITIDQILPVELASFDATAGDGFVRLNWATVSETDNDYFTIKRDGVNIARINSLGNTASGHEYSYTDEGVTNGVSYSYSLIAVDVNGAQEVLASAEATPTAGANLANEYALNQNYPNPFNPSTTISFSLKEAGNVVVKVFNITGEEVAMLVNESRSAGSYSVAFDATNLPSGLYFYRMEAGDFSATHKMVLMK
ncbi:MAG: T9SS type A sorting domain-containing protein [Calditrichota bacterium]